MTPNEISYIKGVEEYIFKWIDIKNLNINNNCNLILLNSCFVDKLNNERFYIIYHEDDLQNENGSLDFNGITATITKLDGDRGFTLAFGKTGYTVIAK
jgi:hypothetical protein